MTTHPFAPLLRFLLACALIFGAVQVGYLWGLSVNEGSARGWCQRLWEGRE